MDQPVRVTISGSYNKHLDRILAARERFVELGAEVLRPRTDRVAEPSPGVVRLEGDPEDASGVHREQLSAIEASDLVYVVNPGGYVGPAATYEVGYAGRASTPVFCAEAPFEAIVAASSQVATPDEAYSALSPS
jgi:hypothetical protein